MNNNRKALLLLLCAVLMAGASVFGTLAYLTDTEAVTNTFTVGSVGLELDEADVKPDGTIDTDNRVQENEYHLVPGHTYIKDPTVTVDEGSEDSYIRMIVTVENINKLKAALPEAETIRDEDGTTVQVAYPENTKYYGEDGTFLVQMLCGDWNPEIWKFAGYTENDDGTEGHYEFRYYQIVGDKEDDSGQNFANKLPALFKNITVPGEIDNDHLAYLKDVKIVVSAHAIQADGFDDADAAWAAFDAQVNP